MSKVLILGGTGAIGLEIARILKSDTTTITIASRSSQKLAESISKLGGRTASFQADVSDAEGISKIAAYCSKEKPDIVVHAYGGTLAFANEVPGGGWRECMELYFFRAVAIDQMALPGMLSRQSGRILHLTSYATVDGNGFPPYIAAKAALNQYIRSQGIDLARRGVTLAGVMPRAVEGGNNRWVQAKRDEPKLYEATRSRQPSDRFQTPEEVATTCRLIIHATDSSYSGKILPVPTC